MTLSFSHTIVGASSGLGVFESLRELLHVRHRHDHVRHSSLRRVRATRAVGARGTDSTEPKVGSVGLVGLKNCSAFSDPGVRNVAPFSGPATKFLGYLDSGARFLVPCFGSVF